MSCTILQFSNEAAQTGLFLVAISWKSSKEKGYLEVNGGRTQKVNEAIHFQLG